jgi:hypothetical protein
MSWIFSLPDNEYKDIYSTSYMYRLGNKVKNAVLNIMYKPGDIIRKAGQTSIAVNKTHEVLEGSLFLSIVRWWVNND